MKMKDCIYGEFNIETVLEALINTKEIQRLKNIHQGGASYLVNPRWNVTRYDHSIGVMLLICKMGGSIEEQIAGLLHDISHTAFSHVVDFALDNKEEDYHEKIYERIIESSNIPNILKDFGYNYKNIVYNEEKWTILEKSAPDLCSDRIDYTLRDMFSYGFISKEEVDTFLSDIKVVNGEIVINSIESAQWFVDVYYKEVIGFFMDPLNVYAYQKLSKCIKIALHRGEIKLDDLLEDDNYVLNLLRKSEDKDINELMSLLNYNAKVVEDDKNYDIYQLNKVRTIDPKVVVEGKIYRSSEKSKVIKNLNEKALKQSQKGTYVKIIN